jgi:2-C-methyl-D-erythritol 4-phosphate cytidylyltransferase
MKTYVVLLAGGVGSRVGSDKPKQFMIVAGKTLLEHCLINFETHPLIDAICVITHNDWFSQTTTLLKNFKKIETIGVGGSTRQESVQMGLGAINKLRNEMGDRDEAKVLIHDVARPFTPHKVINAVIEALDSHDAVCPVLASSDTLMVLDSKNNITDYPNRASIVRGQTPQGFKFSVIDNLHNLACQAGTRGKATDDISLVKLYGNGRVKLVTGSLFSHKITTSEDIEWVINLCK